MSLANTKQVRSILAKEFNMVGHMGTNSWTNRCADDTQRTVGVRVGYESSRAAQEAVRQRAEAALRAQGFANEVKVTHVDSVLEARNYGGTYVWVRDLHTGETNNDEVWCNTVADYLQTEGYAEQHVSAQCGVLYNNWMKEHAE